jgi:hypothetical protein
LQWSNWAAGAGQQLTPLFSYFPCYMFSVPSVLYGIATASNLSSVSAAAIDPSYGYINMTAANAGQCLVQFSSLAFSAEL